MRWHRFLLGSFALWWLIGVAPACAQHPHTTPAPAAISPHDATSDHSFEDVDRWKKVFDDPRRDEWQKPAELVQALHLEPGMTVADLGAGTGYFSRYLSQAVGKRGTVLAVEIEPKLVDYIRNRAEQEKTDNVVPVLASAGDARLPYRKVDLVLIVDTYHHFNDRLTYLRRLMRGLTPGGRVAVVDWFKHELPEGPPPDHKLAREHVAKEMQAAGYELIEEPTFLPYQYFLIFKVRSPGH